MRTAEASGAGTTAVEAVSFTQALGASYFWSYSSVFWVSIVGLSLALGWFAYRKFSDKAAGQ